MKMDKDFDFDFEKEFGFDPKAFLDADGYDEDIDLSEFSDEDLGLSAQEQPDETPADDFGADLDLEGLDLSGDFGADEDLNLDDLLGSEEEEPDEQPEEPFAFSGDPDFGRVTDFSEDDFDDEPDFPEEDFDDEPDFPEDTFEDEPVEDDFGDEPDFPDGMFGGKQDSEEAFGDEPDSPEGFEAEETDMNENMDYSEETGSADPAEFADGPVGGQKDTPREPRPRRERKPRAPKEPKEAKPSILTKFFDLYFAPVLNKSMQEQPADPNNPRRRRKKSKAQIFKEVYLPPIIACVCLILILSFVIGAISNAIEQNRLNAKEKENQLQASISEAEEAEAEYQRIMDQAAQLAANYDYQGAADMLENSIYYNEYPEMQTKRAEYITIKDSLVEYKDPSLLPNLSFHVLMADPARAVADTELGGLYNRNFVTTGEFSKILEQLYSNGYVLVDFDSFLEVGQTVSGDDQFFTKSIYLPEGKKPFMLTETMVNYFEYMIDSNKDGVADAGGDGFASKLVLDDNGDIKAEYVDASGTTLVGNYDLVPILEDFIAEHPDFSYKGARAVLAVTGEQGIFGYRCNTSYVSTKGNDYYDQEKAGAIEIVNALKQKGYTLACYTYANAAYGQLNSAQITADLASWTQQITPIIGEIDTFVFAKLSDLSDYSGAAFKALYSTGFRYFIADGKSPLTTVNNTYIHQDRLMVTGENMVWYSDRFTGMFDCNLVVDLTSRGGSVPKS